MKPEPKDWPNWTAAHSLKVGDKVTIGPLDEEGVRFFQANGFKVLDGKIECVVTRDGISQSRRP